MVGCEDQCDRLACRLLGLLEGQELLDAFVSNAAKQLEYDKGEYVDDGLQKDRDDGKEAFSHTALNIISCLNRAPALE